MSTSGTSVFAYGLVLGPADANVEIAAIASTSLAAGLWDVAVMATYSGTLTAATERSNMKLVIGASSLVLPIPGASPNNPSAVLAMPPIRVRLDGETGLAVKSVAAGTATANYIATIIATPIGYGSL